MPMPVEASIVLIKKNILGREEKRIMMKRRFTNLQSIPQRGEAVPTIGTVMHSRRTSDKDGDYQVVWFADFVTKQEGAFNNFLNKLQRNNWKSTRDVGGTRGEERA